MTFTFINAPASPWGRKVAIALEEKGIAHETIVDNPWGNESISSRYNPLAQIPVLVPEKGAPIYDSHYILNWLEARYPAPPLLPADTEARLAVQFRQMLGERLMDFGSSVMFEVGREHPDNASYERYVRKIPAALDTLEAIYAEEKAGGLPVDLGDITVVSTLDVFTYVTSIAAAKASRIAELHWQDGRPALVRLVEQMSARPAFAKTKPRPTPGTGH